VGDFRVLVTGSRNCDEYEAQFVAGTLDRLCSAALANAVRVVIVEGECPKGGVDRAARNWAEATPGAEVEPHPADWDRHGRAAGPIRNSEMVKSGANWCLGFPSPGSRGTWDCIRKAADAGIPVRIYPLAMATALP
jgi:hypothetical protein